ncbi:MAG: DUF3099 domain-containing protein [Agromyces sp.]|nr:DUF3099 domain-containing protein [Agromyces sp.]
MKQQSITTLPPSPEAERRSRMIKYTIAMSIRVACIFCMLFAQGWWLVVFAAGAVFLPYVAVVLANVSGPSRNDEVLRPGSIVPVGTPPDGDARPEEGSPEAGTWSEPAPDAPAPEATDPDADPTPARDAGPAASDRDGDERGAA